MKVVTPIISYKGFLKNKIEEIDFNVQRGLFPQPSIRDFFEDLKNDKSLDLEKVDTPLEIIFLDRLSLFNNEEISNVIFERDKSSTTPKPKIFIGTLDIAKQDELIIQNEFRMLNAIDNNIWTYYLKVEKRHFFIDKLKCVLDIIKDNYEFGLYNSRVCQEYIEIHSRVVKENIINGLGGHGTQVKPFVFTSETVFKDKVQICLNNLVQNIKTLGQENIEKDTLYSSISIGIKWRILLVDDFSTNSLNRANDGISGKNTTNKISILKKRINELNGLVKGLHLLTEPKNKQIEGISFTIKIDVAKSISEAKEKLESETYDIILLDYLFSEDREYGIKLLKELKTNDSLKKGPFGEFWIIPISVFSNAFIDDMRNQDISFVDEIWNLSRGGDFVNTPWLFLYYFTLFQSNQIIRGTKLFTSEIDNDIDSFIKTLQIESKPILEFKNKALINYQKLILDFKDFASLDSSESNLINSLTTLLHTHKNNSYRKIKHYHTFLYNLSFRNYDNNEDIAIEYHILNSLIQNNEKSKSVD